MSPFGRRDGCLLTKILYRDIAGNQKRNESVRTELCRRTPAGLKQQRATASEQAAPSWNLSGEAEMRDFVGHAGCVNAIAFSPSGSLLLSGSDDTTVKLWEVESRRCLRTLPGHVSNVFATEFLPQKCEMEFVSGGNEADIRYWQMGQDGSAISTVYRHHTRKVLRICVLPHSPDAFLSCSADGTVRMFDTRMRYSSSECENVPQDTQTDIRRVSRGIVLPQALGGGRTVSELPNGSGTTSSLLLNFDKPHQIVYSLDCHPTDGHSFVIACEDGLSRLYDIRCIATDPHNAVNIYTNVESPTESTGVAFSWNGAEIAVTNITDNIYLYDTDVKFEDTNYQKPQARARSPHDASVFEVLREIARRRAEREMDNFRAMADSDMDNDSDSDSNSESSGLSPEDLFVQMMMQRMEDSEDGEEEPYDPFACEEDQMECEGSGTVYQKDEGKEDALLASMPNVPSAPPSHTYKGVFSGHISERTIKGVSFYGARSEYIMSGSDDGRIYFWDKKSSRLIACLAGHTSIVNNVVQHPHLPAVASSGIDDVVKLWTLENIHDSEEDSWQFVSDALARDEEWSL